MEEKITIKELLTQAIDWFSYLRKKWVVIFLIAFLSGGIGVLIAYNSKTEYKAVLSFVLEDDKGGGGGLAGAMGLASTLGVDLGTSAGGAFTGGNLIQLMKSRTLVEKALLTPLSDKDTKTSLAEHFIQFNKLNKNWSKDPAMTKMSFEPYADRGKFNLQQDSVMGEIYHMIAGKNGQLSVIQQDKKTSIITVQVKSIDQVFSKEFSERIVQVVSDFYIQTKSKKARNNVMILQNQADSVRRELNDAISGVASSTDNTFNLNPALNIKRTPGSRRQVDVQANTAILTQLVTNLEMAKVTLMKETPLIQLIDTPIYPLEKIRVGKTRSLILGGFIGGVIAVCGLVIIRMIRRALNADS